MLTIGITGGIGSGKSTVAAVFALLGIPVLQADQLAKTIMQENREVQNRIITAFGEAAYINGRLNTAHIANIVFKDPYQLSVLNSIVHPVTIAESIAWANRQKTPYVIKEAALFFESGSSQGLNGIIGVSAPGSLRIKRVMDRDGLSRQQVLDRMQQQINADLKMKLCDWVIVNDELQLIIPQVLLLHKKLLALSGN
ncbi:MAG: dephospho-CoA kinase [Sediminibacterium sp.]|nr:dephospho-CoA kinase [Sediminibacterium sp.]